MSRRIPTGWLLFFLSILVVTTILRWELVWKSTLSLAYALTSADLEAGRLVEFWIAAVVWWLLLAFLLGKVVLRLARTSPRELSPPPAKSRWNLAAAFLAFMVFVSLCAPFLAPVPPNSQGNLATSRLLPPLARGMQFESPEPGHVSAQEGAKGVCFEATQWLLSRRSTASAPDQAPPSEGVSTRKPVGGFVFVLGTDDNGRDLLSRIIAGARVSLGIGVTATLLSVLIGSLIGFAAGTGSRLIDFVLMRLTDLALAIPGLFLAIGLMAFLGQSVTTLIVVLACTGWMTAARVIRGEVVALREREFILASRLLGVSRWRIVLRHMLPNLAPVLASMGILQFANVVLAEAALGFLGLGIQPPTASWGNMMGEAMGTLRGGWWVGVFPGALLACVLVAAHDLAEAGSAREHGDGRNRYDQSSIQDHS